MARTATYQTCESHHRLDVRELARDGLLQGSGTITWSRGNRITGAVSVNGNGNEVTLTYVSEGDKINEKVRLDKTPVHFGGTRSWFLCGGCEGRVGVLYGGKYFRCRHCHNLRYASQRESKKFRAISKVRRIRRKLRGSANLLNSRPDRPRYMHKRTYARLVREEEAAWQAVTSIFSVPH